MRKEKKCCLCSQIAGDSNNDLLAKLIKADVYIRRVPFENEHFAVIPSLGPLVPGHTLICPKQHYRSFAGIPEEYEVEYSFIKEKLRLILQHIYKNPVHCFEHGTAKAAVEPLCTVDHAHLHCVPASVDISIALEQMVGWQDVGDTLSDLKCLAEDSEYLYYESPRGVRKIMTAPMGTLESQYLRRVFANAVGNDNQWNWRETPCPLAAHEAYEQILNAGIVP